MNRNNPEIAAADLAPDNIEQALNLIEQGFIPVAGGTDLMVRRHAQKKSAWFKAELPPVFSCSRIAGTDYIRVDGNRFALGSSVRLTDIINHKSCPVILKESLLSIASPGIRNIATLTGNICNASPAADSLPTLYILNAEIETAHRKNGGGIIIEKFPIQEFIKGPGKTAGAGSFLVTGLGCDIPDNYTPVFRKVGTRAANALSKLSIAAVYKINAGVFTDFRIAAGACAPTVIRSIKAEKLLTGCKLINRHGVIEEVIEIYKGLIKPIDDQRSTAAYRKNTALKIIRDIIITAGD